MESKEYIQKADSIVSNHLALYRKSFPQVGVLLSGGIDSSVISTYIHKNFINPIFFSMGTAQTKDKPFVELFSQSFPGRFEWIELSDVLISEALPVVSELLAQVGVENSTMQRSLAVGYYLIFKRASDLNIKGIVTGQGPDILFAGYHKYKGMSGDELTDEIKKDLILLETDKKRDSAMAAHFGITLLNPYLEQDFVDFSLSVPAELKIKDGVEKYFMRAWGKTQGLPEEILVRPKKAFQYSTGLQKRVAKIQS